MVNIYIFHFPGNSDFVNKSPVIILTNFDKCEYQNKNGSRKIPYKIKKQ